MVDGSKVLLLPQLSLELLIKGEDGTLRVEVNVACAAPAGLEDLWLPGVEGGEGGWAGGVGSSCCRGRFRDVASAATGSVDVGGGSGWVRLDDVVVCRHRDGWKESCVMKRYGCDDGLVL